MARRPRIHVQNGVYHAMLRGNNKQDIFFNDTDYEKMKSLIYEGVERFGHKVLAYCFMQNHIHLAIQVDQTPLSKIMQNIAFRYTSYINTKKNLIGHLFQGRFKSVLIDGDKYLAHLIRYIHLNPVRAKLVQFPEQYPWSSHRMYMRHKDSSMVDCEEVLNCFSKETDLARQQFHEYVLAGINGKHSLDFKTGLNDGIFGSKEFIKKIGYIQKEEVARSVDIPTLIEVICDRFQLGQDELIMKNSQPTHVRARTFLAYLVHMQKETTLTELSHYLGSSASTLSFHANKLAREIIKTPELIQEINALKHRAIEQSKLRP